MFGLSDGRTANLSPCGKRHSFAPIPSPNASLGGQRNGGTGMMEQDGNSGRFPFGLVEWSCAGDCEPVTLTVTLTSILPSPPLRSPLPPVQPSLGGTEGSRGSRGPGGAFQGGTANLSPCRKISSPVACGTAYWLIAPPGQRTSIVSPAVTPASNRTALSCDQ